MKFTKRGKIFTCVALLFVAIAAVTAGIVIWQTRKDKDNQIENDQIENGFPSAAISCDAPGCADIGKDMLLRGGSVVDAAIPTLLCMGVTHAQSMGIGGGFFATLYNATKKEAKVLNARETAPAAAHEDMYEGNATLSQRGPLAVAVPGEMKGLWELYKQGGRLPWADLLEPIIRMCRDGFLVSPSAAAAMRDARAGIFNQAAMMDIFVNPRTGDLWEEGDTMFRPKLADTLEIIANSQIGGDELYEGEVGRWLVEDLAELGGIITRQDLLNYRVKWETPMHVDLHGDITVYTVPPPGSGLLMSFIMNVVSDYLPPTLTSTAVQRIVEAMKHTYASRTHMGDPFDSEVTAKVEELMRNLTSTDYILAIRDLMDDKSTNNTYEYYGAEYYQPEDHGTAHMSIIGPNGDAIAITSTVNLFYGAYLRSPRTGIIYNDEMDDFSSPGITNAFGVPPSPNNFIKPGKRPVSSMTPSVFVNKTDGRVRLVIGGAGGTKITTQSAIVAIRNLWFGESIMDAVAAPRIHHQLYPMQVDYEAQFDGNIIDDLRSYGHDVYGHNSTSAVIGALARGTDGLLYASSDWRKTCSIAGF